MRRTCSRLASATFALLAAVAVPVLTVLSVSGAAAPQVQAAAGAAGAAAAGGSPSGASAAVPLPAFEVDRTTRCVLPAARMRLEHPSLLTHQRDRAVHLGLSDAQVSMKACVGCHAGVGAGASAGAVVGHDQAFCESCHRYAAVRIDCFDCHRSRPEAAR
ncbi:MAG: hypothetical protein AB7P21_12015 [Lautropia sp.]